MPVARVPDFIAAADAAVLEAIPGARIVAFGHLGDGNIHYNISQPVGADADAFLARWHEMNDLVHGIVAHLRGGGRRARGLGGARQQGAQHGIALAHQLIGTGILTVHDTP